MGFQVNDFIVTQGRVGLITKVETPDPGGFEMDMGRYTIQWVDGSTLSNAPGYLMKRASDKQVEDELGKAGMTGT